MSGFTIDLDESMSTYELACETPAISGTSLNLGHCKNGNTYLLQLCSNGDIFVKGELCENSKEIVQAAYEFFCIQWPKNLREIHDTV